MYTLVKAFVLLMFVDYYEIIVKNPESCMKGTPFMKKVYYIFVPILFCILISCSQKTEQEGFFPSSHTVSIDLPEPSTSSARARYKTFDRKKILNKVSENKGYEALIQNARNSVGELIAKSDEELRALFWVFEDMGPGLNC